MSKTILDLSNLSLADTRRLNEIAGELKKAYSQFVDDICRKYGANPLFWATPFVSRNIYNDSDTFLSLTRVFLAIEKLNGKAVSHIITIYESEKKVLESIASKDVCVYAKEKKPLADSLRKTVIRLSSWTFFSLQELSYMRHSRKNSSSLGSAKTVIITPVLSSSFDGRYYNDRYFSGIMDYKDVHFLPMLNNNTTSSKDFIDRVENCENYKFILPFYFLSFFDFWDILKYWHLVNNIKKDTFIFEGLDISPVIQRCLEEGKTNTPAFKGILARKIIRRMSEKGVPVDNFIIWYEGRPSDVMAASAIREFFPNAGCVGFEGYPIQEINLAASISDYQYRSGHSPKTMAIPGKAYEPLAHCFCPDVPLVYIPILRNQYALRQKKKTDRAYKTIFAILPYWMDIAGNMLRDVLSYARNTQNPCRVLLKNHPVNSTATLASYGIMSDDCKLEFVTGKLEGCLKEADVVVTSVTSSTLEVLFAGIPLIIMYPRGRLGYTALPPKVCDGMYSVVYGERELSGVLDYWLAAPPPDNSVLKNLLVEKNTETVGRMFR